MQIVKLKNGLGLNVQVLNPEGIETVLMVHGMFGNLSHFYLTIAPFIASDYKVVLFDLKSQGRSDKIETGYDLKTFAEDVIGLADALGLEKIHLLGYSLGSLVVLKCAMDFPTRVGKVVVIEIPDKAKDPFLARGLYTYEHFQRFVLYLNTDIRENFFRSKRQMMTTFKMHEYIYNHTTFSEDMNNEKEFDKDDYAKIVSPLMIAFGAESVCFCEFERIKNWVPFADVYLEEGGHGFFLEKAEICSQRILRFLKSPDVFPNPLMTINSTAIAESC